MPPKEASFDSDAPDARTAALSEAVASNDRESIPDLIVMLDADDPAARMLAIRTLERWTGQTLGYRHSDPEPDRRAAAARWADWAVAEGLVSAPTDPLGEGEPLESADGS